MKKRTKLVAWTWLNHIYLTMLIKTLYTVLNWQSDANGWKHVMPDLFISPRDASLGFAIHSRTNSEHQNKPADVVWVVLQRRTTLVRFQPTGHQVPFLILKGDDVIFIRAAAILLKSRRCGGVWQWFAGDSKGDGIFLQVDSLSLLPMECGHKHLLNQAVVKDDGAKIVNPRAQRRDAVFVVFF